MSNNRKDETINPQSSNPLLKRGQEPEKEKEYKFDIVREGSRLVLPENVSLKDMIGALQRKMEQDELTVNVWEEVECFPLDGAYAFSRVLQQKYGWADAVNTVKKGMFGDIQIPPITVSLEIGYNKTIPIFWGSFMVPGVQGSLETAICRSNKFKEKMVFVVRGSVKQKDRALVKELLDAVREYVKANSIYKGKAIRLRTDNEGKFDYETPPTFMDTSQTKPEELVFSEIVMEQIQTNIFTPIEKTEECKRYGVPLKLGVLLESTYGTGKTMTANVTAHKAEKHGWTFIYVDRVSALRDAIGFAREYAPAVLFAEDIDRVMGGERDMDVDDILNIIDGVDSKNSEIITILTTNDIHSIEKAMLRPGRLDAVISVTPPDAKAAEKLMRMYGRGLIDLEENLQEAGKELAGQIPAVIREVVERSKRYAIGRSKEGDTLILKGSDLVASARGMKNHLALLAERPAEPSREQVFGNVFKDLVKDSLNGSKEQIEDTHLTATRIARSMGINVN